MLWTVLVFLLLCAIGGALWLHYRQEQEWRRELSDFADNGELPEDMRVGMPSVNSWWRHLIGLNPLRRSKAGQSSFQARLRLLAAQKQMRAEDTETWDYVDDQTVFSAAETEQEDKVQYGQSARAKGSVRLPAYPEIVPFVEMEVPEYRPRKVSGTDWEEITLQDARQSLSEAVMQEYAERSVHAPAATEKQAEPSGMETLIKTSRSPIKGLEIIDLDDPVLRRTRNRVLADVDSLHLKTMKRAETANLQTASDYRSAVAAGISSNRIEISMDSIQNDLARQSAARGRLAAAVAPVRHYQPPTIQSDEILANLGQQLPRRQARSMRHIEAARQDVSGSERSVQGVSAVKTNKPQGSQPQQRAYVSPFAARSVSAVPDVSAQTVSPETVSQPSVAPQEALAQNTALVEKAAQSVSYHPTESEVTVSAHISNYPERSIHDFLTQESGSSAAVATPVGAAVWHEEEVSDVAPVSDVKPQQPAILPSAKTEESQAEFTPVSNRLSAPEPVRLQAAHTEVLAEQTPSPVVAPVANINENQSGTTILPSLDLLLPPQFDPSAKQTEEALLENSITIEEKLAEFKVKVKVMDAYSGPVITRYEIEPDVGVRGNSVLNLEKDLARSLGVASIRVVETIPGKTCMGLELPNPRRQTIRLSEIFNSQTFKESRSKLTLALGQDITGEPVVTDLAKAPHLLVAGTTGSGKSVGVNAMILSMLFKATPEEVRMIMIDPKMLELSIYEGIPHLLAPVVTDMKLAANALNWCVNEMEKRYRLMSHAGVRNLAGFNQKIAEAAARGEKIVNPFTLTPDNPEYLEKLPFIVVVVDEFADLMMTAGKKIEELIARLAQKARAAGIHLILATQRPSVDVITGLIKANIPTRIAFQVSGKVDSRTILDQMGAENLLGQGDMLFLPPGTGYPQRVHGAFASDEEVHHVVEYLKQFGEPDYIDEILSGGMEELPGIGRSNDSDVDPMYDEAVAFVIKSRKASISGVQRALRIGYNRAARLIDQMESDGIVSAPESNGNRTILARSSEHLDD
ncbi:DNA translocase FtsK [Neisseria animalis]|uniref:Cell division protein FtsK n=1 Tax=Neisseria animalis TaxID=492 RepID=A0A5P3MQL2_NEIAN|nr:DNA translocase FtsK [Neisseria animalis]QEY23091.1 cell division protein FtsK [Neisseria animalis]ROW32424.1 cell division protein FtsK [Neisseria animalis]VEE08111.1 putative cell-division protein [Neisseria animalis]